MQSLQSTLLLEISFEGQQRYERQDVLGLEHSHVPYSPCNMENTGRHPRGTGAEGHFCCLCLPPEHRSVCKVLGIQATASLLWLFEKNDTQVMHVHPFPGG